MTDAPRGRLRYSSSPRASWLWAPDEATARQVRTDLDAGSHYWAIVRRGREQLPLVTDVEIGVTAYDACHHLAALGYTFAWHEEVLVDDRHGWAGELSGMR